MKVYNNNFCTTGVSQSFYKRVKQYFIISYQKIQSVLKFLSIENFIPFFMQFLLRFLLKQILIIFKPNIYQIIFSSLNLVNYREMSIKKLVS
jgi:hypothetical protein